MVSSEAVDDPVPVTDAALLEKEPHRPRSARRPLLRRIAGGLATALFAFVIGALPAGAAPPKRVTTDKARYDPATSAVISAHVSNDLGYAISGYALLSIRYLDQTVYAETQAVSLADGASQTYTFTWTVPAETFRGYGLDVDVYHGGSVVKRYAGALDVSDDWARAPRYGFMSDYPVGQSAAQSASIIEQLNRYHIDAIQFYDWMYKHQDVLREESGVVADTYVDVAGRTISLPTIRNQVQASADRNMRTMAYDLVYGELTGIDSPSLFANSGQFVNAGDPEPDSHPLAFWGSTIWLMDPADADWRDTIYAEYVEAIEEVGFEGIHLDQLGNRGTRYDTDGSAIDFTTAIPGFIDAALTAIRTADADARIAFNTVDAWPLQPVAASNADILYSEVWTPTTYSGLRTLIASARQYAPEKRLVLPAYMNKNEAESIPYMDSPSVLLTDAAVFANGAFRIEIGESHAMLSTEYFADHTPPMDDGLIGRLYDVYDFIVRYENLLYEDAVDVTDDAVAWTSLAEGLSKTGAAGAVWNIVKARPDEIVVHLVNLIGVDDDWRDTTAPPTLKTGFDYKYYTNQPVTAVFFASPDTDGGRPTALSFYTGHDEPYGNYVYVQNVPRLEYWDMLILKTGATASPPSSSSHEVYVPWFTPTVDGTVDSGYGIAVASDSENGTNGQANSPMDLQNLYLAHDTSFVYLAFTINKNVATASDSWGKYVVSIDTDGAGGGGGAVPAWTRAVTFSAPHRPDYEIYAWMNAAPFDTTDIQRWRYDGAGWANVGTIDLAARDTAVSLTTVEYKIAKSDVGALTTPYLRLEVWATGGTNGDNAQDSIDDPKDDANPGDWTTSTPLKVSTFCHFVPPRIGGLRISNVQDDLSLAWDPIDVDGFSRYEVFRGSAPFHDVTAMTPIGALPTMAQGAYLDTTVAPGETYYYAVVAVNALGDSDPFVHRWEAERGLIGKNAAVDADHPSYGGDAFVDQLDADEANDWVRQTVSVGEAGYRTLSFRYSAGGGATVGRLDVNDVEVAWPTLPATASWDTWATATRSVWLDAGENEVKLGFEAGNAAFNYDYLEMENPSGYVKGKVVLNEILPDSLDDSTGVDADEWVEVYNASDTSIGIGSWRLVDYDGEIYTFPAGLTLPAYSFAVVHIDTGVDETDFSDGVAHLYARGTPGDDMFEVYDQVGLYDAEWGIVDFVAFGPDADADSDAVAAGIWTDDTYVVHAGGEGRSLHLLPDGADSNSVEDWRATTQAGRASEGGTNDGMDAFDSSVGTLAFMLPNWSGPLPADSVARMDDTLYVQMENDFGNPAEIDVVQVRVTSTVDSAVSVTLKETSLNGNILRGTVFVCSGSVSSMDRIGATNGETVAVQDLEGPDRAESILVLPTGRSVSGTVTLQAGASDAGCTVRLSDGAETYTAVSQAPAGTFVVTGVGNGTFTLRFEAFHHLSRRSDTPVVVSGADTDVGTHGDLRAGDANGDDLVDIFDASRVKGSLGTANATADIDGSGTVDAADLQWIRDNYLQRGDPP